MHEFWVKRQTLGTSTSLKSQGEPMVTITLKGAHDNETYRTYVVRSHANWANWQQVLQQGNRDLLIGFETIKYIGRDRDIIDADCQPHVIRSQSRRPRTAREQAVLDTIDVLRSRVEDLFNDQ